MTISEQHLSHSAGTVSYAGWCGAGSLDTDGICISKVPTLDTDDIGSLANVQGLVCMGPLDRECLS